MRLGNFGWKVDPARTLPPLPSLPRKAWERGFNPGLPLPTCPSLSSLGAQLLSKLSGHSFLWVIHFRDAPEASVGQSWELPEDTGNCPGWWGRQTSPI